MTLGMTQTSYSSDFQMGSGFCEFLSLSFKATPNKLQVLFVSWSLRTARGRMGKRRCERHRQTREPALRLALLEEINLVQTVCEFDATIACAWEVIASMPAWRACMPRELFSCLSHRF